MAVIIRGVDHGFVQIEEPVHYENCVPQPSFCLPIAAPEELVFQMIVQVSGADRDWFLQPEGEDGEIYTIWAALCRDCELIGGISPTSLTFKSQWVLLGSETEGYVITDTYVGSFYFNNNDLRWEMINNNECFQICFYRVRIDPEDESGEVNGIETEQIACSETCFFKISDTCNTSLFAFSCNENSLGYYYQDDLPANKIRLACYPRDFQLPSEEKSYQKSNGVKRKLFERINEDYELRVDWAPKWRHKRLKILLAHDNITIDNIDEFEAGVPVGIICTDKYEMEWPDMKYGLAPAKTRIARTENISSLNTNCA